MQGVPVSVWPKIPPRLVEAALYMCFNAKNYRPMPEIHEKYVLNREWLFPSTLGYGPDYRYQNRIHLLQYVPNIAHLLLGQYLKHHLLKPLCMYTVYHEDSSFGTYNSLKFLTAAKSASVLVFLDKLCSFVCDLRTQLTTPESDPFTNIVRLISQIFLLA